MKNGRKAFLLLVFFLLQFCVYSQPSTVDLLDEQILRLTTLSENWLMQKQELEMLQENLKTAETQLETATVQLNELKTTLQSSQQNCLKLSLTLEQSERKLKLWKTLCLSFISSTVVTTTVLIIMEVK